MEIYFKTRLSLICPSACNRTGPVTISGILCVYVCLCVCVILCVWDILCVCVCVCVCVRQMTHRNTLALSAVISPLPASGIVCVCVCVCVCLADR